MEFWGPKTFCLVTGASRGIGKCISIEFAKKAGPNSTFLLVARSKDALEATKEEILNHNENIVVMTASLDLSKPDPLVYNNLIESTLKSSNKTSIDYDRILLVHNAGSLGNITLKVTELNNLANLQDYYQFNVYSLIILTTEFFKIFNNSNKLRQIVQISSLGAVKPFKTWGLYCSGKAARDMLIKSIAEEEINLRCINWAPGPVDTDIYTQAATQTGDIELLKTFQDSKQKGEILTCRETVGKLIKILQEGKFIKGEHVDYYDV